MKKPILLYGCDANSFYASGMDVPDPYALYISTRGEKHMLLSALEVDRARKQAQVDRVWSLEDYHQPGARLATTLVFWISTIEGTLPDGIIVPDNFPASLFVDLENEDLMVEVANGDALPDRAVKTEAEISAIRHAQEVNEQGFAVVFDVLKQAEIQKDRVLRYQGDVLSSERLQVLMNMEIMRLGGTGFNHGPIVACGAQGADPHESGHGALKAEELIIIDSYPTVNHYCGDLTRTVLVGEAQDWQVKLYDAVLQAQEAGLAAVKTGVTGANCHAAAQAALVQAGYETGKDAQGRNYGFYHGLGHSLGLEVHDVGPRLSPVNANPLLAGAVVTVEPGYYIPEKGGVRIEDAVVVREGGYENLTTLPKQLLVSNL